MTVPSARISFKTCGVSFFKIAVIVDPAVKALVSSGYSEDAATTNYEKEGFKAFLDKPYTLDALREVINKVFNIRSRFEGSIVR